MAAINPFRYGALALDEPDDVVDRLEVLGHEFVVRDLDLVRVLEPADELEDARRVDDPRFDQRLVPRQAAGVVAEDFAAITAAYLGGLNPLGIVPASLLIAALTIGGDSAMVAADLPVAAVLVVQGTILVAYVSATVLVRYRLARRRPAPAAPASLPLAEAAE